MPYCDLLKALGREMGGVELTPNESGMVLLATNDTSLTIVGDEMSGMVVLMADIAPIPFARRDEFFAMALRANWLGSTGGAVLAINPKTEQLALNRYLPMSVLTDVAFVEEVRRFLETLCRWSGLAADWGDSLVEQGDEAAGNGMESSDQTWRDFIRI